MRGSRTSRAWTKPANTTYRPRVKPDYKVVREIKQVLSPPLPAGRRCEQCNAVLRSGNQGKRCGPCELKRRQEAVGRGDECLP